MDNDLVLKHENLVENPTPRVPICLCLDVSGFSEENYIQELNSGLRLFYNTIKKDELASNSIEICIVTFGGTEAGYETDFANLHLKPDPPLLSEYGMDSIGEAVNRSLDLLEKRKDEYKKSGVDFYQPWLVLMARRQSNDNDEEYCRAISRTMKLVNTKKLTVFPIAIGQEIDTKVLVQFSPKRSPLHLQGFKFKEFFQWLCQSVFKIYHPSTGESIRLDVEGIQGWGEL